jgi:hypothetical protein
MEQTFWYADQLVRPFSHSAGVQCRGYSQPLCRRAVDFGADEAFGQVPGKLKEHYGITVPSSAVREMTETHARAMREQERLQNTRPATGVKCVIAEIDGSMIPIVATVAAADRRKTRQVRWTEARLSLAHAQGSATPVFAATLGTTDQAGDQLLDCAIRAGLGKTTALHALGDGAVWIADQVQRVGGQQGRYLVDFYHLCDYLAAAAPSCAPADPQGWLRQQKERLKQSEIEAVQATLAAHLEDSEVADKAAPVRACYRYLVNRPGQFEYKRALDAALPIGSGEVESAHRYVIQRRLKLAGAWWKEETAADMLALRTLRANGQWELYWAKIEQQTGRQAA